MQLFVICPENIFPDMSQIVLDTGQHVLLLAAWQIYYKS